MIQYTEDQQEIVDFLREQLTPEGRNIVVSGAAGSGKTAMLCQFISELLQEGYRIAVTAFTGKATAVLRNKILNTLWKRGMKIPSKEFLLIETVTKITKKSKVLGLTKEGETLYTGNWNDPKKFEYDILFIDELSMVPHYISQWWQATDARVFGFGDDCQLPEVSSGDVRRDLAKFQHDLKLPAMKYIANYGSKILQQGAEKSLTKVLRSDNEIALLSGELRDFSQTGKQIIQRIKDWAAKTDNIQYSNKLADIETGRDWQIIAYTNKTCRFINDKLSIGKDYPALDDKILLHDNLNPLGMYNGDVLTLEEFLIRIRKNNDNPKKRKVYVCMKWENKMPEKGSKNEIERWFFNNYLIHKQTIREINRERMGKIEEVIKGAGHAKGKTDQIIEQIAEVKKEIVDNGDRFNRIMEYFLDTDLDLAHYVMERMPPLPGLYIINCGFGMAVTTHKFQGSEAEKVCLIIERIDKPLIYTGVTRAKQRLKIVNLTKIE